MPNVYIMPNTLVANKLFVEYLRLVRVIKPNPADPDWKFPHCSRKTIEKLERYFSTFHERNQRWGQGKDKPVLPSNRKNKIPWESVPPHRRHIAQQLFDGYMEKCRKQGRPITWGVINSYRCVATRLARTTPAELHHRYEIYATKKKMWLCYQNWLNEQRRAELFGNQEKNEHKVLQT